MEPSANTITVHATLTPRGDIIPIDDRPNPPLASKTFEVELDATAALKLAQSRDLYVSEAWYHVAQIDVRGKSVKAEREIGRGDEAYFAELEAAGWAVDRGAFPRYRLPRHLEPIQNSGMTLEEQRQLERDVTSQINETLDQIFGPADPTAHPENEQVASGLLGDGPPATVDPNTPRRKEDGTGEF